MLISLRYGSTAVPFPVSRNLGFSKNVSSLMVCHSERVCFCFSNENDESYEKYAVKPQDKQLFESSMQIPNSIVVIFSSEAKINFLE